MNTELEQRALQAYKTRRDEHLARKAAANAQNLEYRKEIFELCEQPEFRRLTAELLGTQLDIQMDPETGQPIPVPINDLVSLTITTTHDLTGTDYDHLIGEYPFLHGDEIERIWKGWYLVPVSSFIPWRPDAVNTLDDLGYVLAQARENKAYVCSREETRREEIEEEQGQARPLLYDLLDLVQLNNAIRPFEIVGQPVNTDEGILVLVRYTD